MYPILFQWGSFILPAWHTFYVIGAIVAFLLLVKLSDRFLANKYQRSMPTLFAVCYVGGYLGARLFSAFVDENLGIAGALVALMRLGPMTFYGGAIGATLFGVTFIVVRKLPLAQIFDIAIISGLAALSVGRIGCFLNGDDYGKPLDDPTNATWLTPAMPNLADDIPRYPVQIISTITVALLVIFFIWKFRKIRDRWGAAAAGILAMSSYSILRFLIEYLRGDPRGSFGYFSTSQFVSIVILMCGIVAWFATRRQEPTVPH